jgi:hypothetical protein
MLKSGLAGAANHLQIIGLTQPSPLRYNYLAVRLYQALCRVVRFLERFCGSSQAVSTSHHASVISEQYPIIA